MYVCMYVYIYICKYMILVIVYHIIIYATWNWRSGEARAPAKRSCGHIM